MDGDEGESGSLEEWVVPGVILIDNSIDKYIQRHNET
jgi:hypothetical protein